MHENYRIKYSNHVVARANFSQASRKSLVVSSSVTVPSAPTCTLPGAFVSISTFTVSVGVSVGSSDGASVGVSDGSADGVREGVSVGKSLGIVLGMVDGDSVWVMRSKTFFDREGSCDTDGCAVVVGAPEGATEAVGRGDNVGVSVPVCALGSIPPDDIDSSSNLGVG